MSAKTQLKGVQKTSPQVQQPANASDSSNLCSSQRMLT